MITRRQDWLRCICAVVVFGLFCGWAHAVAPVVTTVYPTGSFPLDVQNVQAAIDRGGTVRLKAVSAAGQPTAFDFGPADPAAGSGVNLTTDVRILGERAGPYATTINGGFVPILGQVPVRSTIQGINFEGPLDGPIVLTRSTGADIIGNRIRGVVPLPLRFGFTETEGIFVSGFSDPQNAITGRIRIADNTILMSGGDFANGMQFDEVTADIEVSGNTVQFLQSNGVIQTIGILVFRSHGNVNVVNNQVVMGPGDPNAFPAGMFIGGHPEAHYLIAGNTVTTNHPNSDGIDVVGLANSGATENAIVLGNHVVTHSTLSTAGGMGFDGAVQHSLMAANRIEGASGNAIQILGLDSALVADSNLAVGNDISQLSALAGDVFFGLDSTNNLFVGHCKTYVDLGAGNRIFCGASIGSARSAAAVGSDVSSARTPSRRSPMADVGVLGSDIQRVRLEALRNRLPR